MSDIWPHQIRFQTSLYTCSLSLAKPCTDPCINGPERQLFHDFPVVFPYIWPLAVPNIAEKGAALVEKDPGRVQDGFGEPLILEMQVFGA